MYKLIRQKEIKVNKKRAEISFRLQEGDIVSLYIKDEFFASNEDGLEFLSIKHHINVIYEDENIMLVDKIPGMLVHSDENETFNTLINHIKSYLYQKGEFNPKDESSFVPSLCNRIDRNTGGIVIAAKNAATLRILNEKIKHKEIRKLYLCLVFGILEEKNGKLSGFIEKNEAQNRVYVSKNKTDNSKTAITLYKVLEEKNNMSLIEAELITGRTHQIRAQFAEIGHPLVGDGKYGKNEKNKEFGRKYQALYSYKVIFDFKTDAEHLEYLKGKAFTVQNVDFAKNFLFV
jgi:23S rRNA pseudouridine955/2504/2580 synthase